MAALDRVYDIEKTISTDKTESTNIINFELIFDAPSRWLYIINDDVANSVYFLKDTIDCFPEFDDIEIKAGELWPPTPLPAGFTCSGLRFVAETAEVIIRLVALA